MLPHRRPCPGDAPWPDAEKPTITCATDVSCMLSVLHMVRGSRLAWHISLIKPYRFDVCRICGTLQVKQPIVFISIDVVDLMHSSQMMHQRAPLLRHQRWPAASPETKDLHF